MSYSIILFNLEIEFEYTSDDVSESCTQVYTTDILREYYSE